jgi:sugar lactone lactonase YvrE
MKSIHAALLASLISLSAFGQATTHPTTVPVGEVHHYTFDHSTLFPGTVRDYWIYVPRQYDPARPACLLVDQDGVQFKSPGVFDQLIAAGDMPVTIAVFVAPGRVKAASPASLDRYNRSFEFDTLSSDYVNFILNEILPDVETKTTTDGRPIHLSQAANDRAIMGASSGAICAFTAAWQRPDSFSRVFSAIGTYVDLRGGNIYPSLIRKFEPKPLRVFLQDGSTDHNNYGGDWWMANQEMERSLTYAGYEVNHVWGTGDHDTKQATAIFADAMKWLWQGWPAPVKAGSGSEQLQQILIPGEGWQIAGEGYKTPDGSCVDAAGEVFFTDKKSGGIWKIGLDGRLTRFVADSRHSTGQGFGPDGRLYSTACADNQIVAYDAAGKSTVIADGIWGNDLVVAADGGVYVTQSPQTPPGMDPGKLWYISPKGQKKIVDTGLKYYDGVTISPDQTMLYATDYRSHWVYTYRIQPGGALTYRQKFYDLYVADADDDAAPDGIRCDRDGRLYVTTRAGIQICDQAGRVVAILPTPDGRVVNLTFGGPNFDELYITCRDKVYMRKLKVRGALPFEPPIKPAPPKL